MTRRTNERLLRTNVLPALGHRDANLIGRAEVRKLLDAIADRAPSEAAHTFVAVKSLYSWLHKDRQEHYHVSAHPLVGLERVGGRSEPRSRTFSDAEVRAIFAAVCGTVLADLVPLLFYCGTRDAETRGMRWADIDLDRAIWTIPGELSKNGRPHVVCLSSGALEVLRRRPRFGEFVFPNPGTRAGHMDRPHSSVLRDVAVRAGLGKHESGLRLHDVRRTVGDRLRQEHGEAMMHAALGHSDVQLTRTYGPTPRLKALAEALEWWSGELGRVLGVAA